MNLTEDPWIPALRADGKRDLFSLQELFAQAHVLRDLSVKPHERIALMRLFVCIAHAALDGPADEEDWETCRSAIQPCVQTYLEKWRSGFELFGDGLRFLQVSNLEPGKDSDEGNATTKLDLALATGNNSTLFDNLAGEERKLHDARSAVNLLTFQCFAPGGRIGVARWNGKETSGKGSANHAPCTPSSMIHSLVLGANLLESLHMNLLDRDLVSCIPGFNSWGKPIWEHPVKSAEDSVAIENATRSFLGRLVPLSRAIRLDPGGFSIVLANGLEYPIFPAFREATATIVARKEELTLLPASPQRSLWRQLAAISICRRAGVNAPSGPLALIHARSTTETTLWVGALVTDKAKIEDVVESIYSLPSGMFDEFGRAAYQAGVEYAETRENALVQSVKVYAGTLKVGAPAYDRARQHFWTHVEQYLSALFDLAQNPDRVADLPDSAWGEAVQDAAFDAYEQTCSRQTPRQIEAYARGLRRLTSRPKSQPQSKLVPHERS